MLIAYDSFAGNQTPAPDQGESPTSHEVAGDSKELRQAKADLDRDVRAYVRAFLSKSPGMTTSDYIERIKPLETSDHLGMFEQYISSDIEQAYIDQGVTVNVVIPGEIEGELFGEDGSRRFEGVVPLKLVMTMDGKRSVLMPATEYHLQMVQATERWKAIYFAPVT
jgi:hypothetical protein